MTQITSPQSYNIVLTQVEAIALSTVAFDNFEWIENAAKNRARIAFDELVQAEVKRRFDEGEQIPSSREEMILDAYQRGKIVSIKDTVITYQTSTDTA